MRCASRFTYELLAFANAPAAVENALERVTFPSGAGLDPESQDLTVFFDDAPVKHIVVTAAGVTGNDRNHSIGRPTEYEETGLSETRFYVTALGPADCAQAVSEGYAHIADLNQDCYIDLLDLAIFTADWQDCMDPTDPHCTHPW